MNKISPTAIIEEGVTLGVNNVIKDHAILRKGTKIGDGNIIEANAVIGPYVIIGNNNYFGISCYIGGDPQDLEFETDTISYIEIGNNNIIREFVTIHRGTKPRTKTIIGNFNFLMAYSHMGHNAKIGDHNILTNTAQLAGYSELGNYVVMSAFTALHQFCKVGDYVMIGGGSKINKDIPPYTMVFGTPAKVVGLNIVGLRRNGFSPEKRNLIKDMYNIFYHSGLPFSKAINKIEELYGKEEEAKKLIDFFKSSKRGIVGFGRSK